jgi:signal peptidase II
MLTNSQKIIWVGLIMLACIIVDQITKVWASTYLYASPPLTFLGNSFRLQYSRNSGSLLGLGAQIPEQARFWAFTVFVGIVLTALLIYLFYEKDLSRTGVVALALILGGGFSNLFSRILDNGSVVDFMNMGIGRIRTGIFNFADVAIFGGLGLLLLI